VYTTLSILLRLDLEQVEASFAAKKNKKKRTWKRKKTPSCLLGKDQGGLKGEKERSFRAVRSIISFIIDRIDQVGKDLKCMHNNKQKRESKRLHSK
jgi:hypothetical protein